MGGHGLDDRGMAIVDCFVEGDVFTMPERRRERHEEAGAFGMAISGGPAKTA